MQQTKTIPINQETDNPTAWPIHCRILKKTAWLESHEVTIKGSCVDMLDAKK